MQVRSEVSLGYDSGVSRGFPSVLSLAAMPVQPEASNQSGQTQGPKATKNGTPLVLIALWIAATWVVHSQYGFVPAVVLNACAVAIGLLWKVPVWLAARYPEVEGKDRFDIENESRKTVAQIIGGAGVVAGLYFTGMTFELSRDRQLTDRFEKATQQLGASDKDGGPSREVRVAAIFSLERIAQESERDHWTIMELLSNYVRARAPWPPKVFPRKGHDCSELAPEADVQVALTVIGRRSKERVASDIRDGHHIDLRGTNLMGAKLRGSHLELADLSLAVLHCADLTSAKLDGAYLFATNLWSTKLADAVFAGAKFSATDVTYTDMRFVAKGLRQDQLDGSHCSNSSTRLPEGLVCPTIAQKGGVLGEMQEAFEMLKKSSETGEANGPGGTGTTKNSTAGDSKKK